MTSAAKNPTWLLAGIRRGSDGREQQTLRGVVLRWVMTLTRFRRGTGQQPTPRHLSSRRPIMASQRKTSGKAAKAASKVLRDGRTGKASKTAAGSALSQAAPKKSKPKKK